MVISAGLQDVHVFLYWVAQNQNQYSRCSLMIAQWGGAVTSLDLLAVLLPVQTGMWLAFIAFRTLIFTSSTSTSRSFSEKPPYSQLVPICSVHGVFASKLQGFSSAFVKPHEVLVRLFFHLAKFPLNGSPALQCINLSSPGLALPRKLLRCIPFHYPGC